MMDSRFKVMIGNSYADAHQYSRQQELDFLHKADYR
jgi:hypothetical protein